MVLPAAAIVDELNGALAKHNTIILTAPPGAGKSTLLPLTILEGLDAKGVDRGKILILEPRRLAARSIAQRMSDMRGEDVGRTIGYRMRFESCVSKETRIEVLTEGILTRMLQSDNALEGVSVVIFDEFHERSLFADVALALCREWQQLLRPDLRIVIMSATIDVDTLSTKLSAPILSCAGRMYDVEIRYEEECVAENAAHMVAHVIRKALKSDEGDILAFLPGEADIKTCEKSLKPLESATLHIMPLYGNLPQSQQRRAISPSTNGERKVVIATPIAETSLTIEGVRVVIDSGLCKQLQFNQNSGLSHLDTVRISMDMADQRAGRAGRTQAGVCYRLWSKATQERMATNRVPEIETADLSSLVLDLAKWGESNPNGMVWLNAPPEHSVRKAKELLVMLGCIDDKGVITEHGKALHKLPCHPRIAEMLLSAKDASEAALAADIAAILEERDPLDSEESVDINLRIEALRSHRRRKREGTSGGHQNVRLVRIAKIAEHYRRLLGSNLQEDNEGHDSHSTGALIASAYPERIASARSGNGARYLLTNGTMASMSVSDYLSHEAWLAIATLSSRDSNGRIFLASPINPIDLQDRVKEYENVTWSVSQERLLAQKELRLGALVLSSKSMDNPSLELVQGALLKAVQSYGVRLLNLREEHFEALCCRISSLKIWHPELDLPDVADEALLSDPSWIAPYLGNVKTSADFRRIDLAEALLASLNYDLRDKLDKLAPAVVEVPSGSRIRLEYLRTGAAPKLSVRLQECFGLLHTPRVNGGATSVVMHLLSPGFKLIQVTQDLASFWRETYFEVRKELYRRYPKHVWPDDPLREAPTRRAKPKER